MSQLFASTKRQGVFAELAFMTRLARLGFTVARPWGDSDRYDFLVPAGPHIWRVQVKSASTQKRGFYMINTATGPHGARYYTPDEIDFLAALLIPLDTWYIIPVAAFTPLRALYLRPGGAPGPVHHFEPYREAWHLLAPPPP